MASLLLLASIILRLLSFSESSSSSKLVLEEGYFVSTLLDFNKLHSASDGGIHPFSLLPSSNSDDLVLLDFSSSTFYTLSLPSSEDAEARVKVLAGNGKLGFSDGESKDVSFNKPKSFAVDEAGNVYVADRLNYVIRKIDKSGFTTTIAGGKAKKIGNTDGPAQNASFSNEFELVYFSKMCALLVVDRGNNLIRQINLNSKDCTNKSHKSGLGIASISVISVLSVLFGSVLGFVARPFLNFRDVSTNRQLSKTWSRFPTNQARATLTRYSGVRNATVKIFTKLIRLSNNYLSLVFESFSPKKVINQKETVFVSLMDQDINIKSDANIVSDSTSFCETNDLKDLVCLSTVSSSCDENDKIDYKNDELNDLLGLSTVSSSHDENEEKDGNLRVGECNNNDDNKLDEMIRAHLSDFSSRVEQKNEVDEWSGFN